MGQIKSQRPDLNRRPAVYETAALPTELRWRAVIVFTFAVIVKQMVIK